MDRKWRLNREAVHSVLPLQEFAARIPQSDGLQEPLATPADLYAVYMLLHIEQRLAELRWSPHAQLYYFYAAAVEGAPATSQSGTPLPSTETPGGFVEEAEAHVVPGVESGSDEDSGDDGPSVAEANAQSSLNAESAPAAELAEAHPKAPAAAKASSSPAQILIPMSSSCHSLTPRVIARFFTIKDETVQQLLLALVDAFGIVTRTSLYNYIQMPLEGSGMAALKMDEQE